MKKIVLSKKFYLLIIFISFFYIGFYNLDIKNNSISKSSIIIDQDTEYYYPLYYESNIFNFNITSNQNMNFSFNYDALEGLSTGSKQLRLIINCTNFLKLNFTALFNLSSFQNEYPDEKNYENLKLDNDYNTVYKISSNKSISNIKIQFIKIPIFGFNKDSQYSIAFYNNKTSLTLLNTKEIETEGYNVIEATIENLQADKNYFITIYKTTRIPSFNLALVITLSILIPISIISIISIISVISKKDYIRKLKSRDQFFPKGVHRLSLDEVLENENRNKIIDLILETPGMHFNELLRKTNLNPGNLVWHLEILNVYKVIKKQTMENYVVYLPYIEKNPISNIDLKLQKSEFTLKILKIIEDDPGIWNTKISENLNINRKTIEYHIRKLEDLGLIYGLKEGNKNKLFPNVNADFFIDRNKKDSLD